MTLTNVEITERFESCGKGNCKVFDFICDRDTFTIRACGETCKIQSGILNCNSQNAEYAVLLLMLVRQKRNLEQDLIIIKMHTGPIEKKRKVSRQSFHEN